MLTAAHCVAGRTPSDLGAISVGGTVRNPARIALHPGWRHRNGTANFLDDVAVVALDAPVPGVPLVKLGGANPRLALILGTGRPVAPGTGHGEGESFDGTLRAAPLETLSDAACARAFRGYRGSTLERFDPRMRCSIDADGKAPLYSGCNGDSGGPLWTGPASAPIQLGVVSWGGDRCGADHLPSVFADVARYRAFIGDPSPAWAPTKTGGSVRISGTARAGRTLTCTLRGFTAEPGTRVGYRWSVVGTGRGGYSPPARVGGGGTYKVAKRDRGKRLACFAEASSAGGFVTLAVASRLVPR